MNFPDFRNNPGMISILMILVGIIILICPNFTMRTIGVVIGLLVLILAAVFLIAGIVQLFGSPVTGIISLVIGIVCVYFSWTLMFDPLIVAGILSLLIYIIGFILIIIGVFNLITGTLFAPLSYLGIVGIIFGVLFLVVGIFIGNPVFLAMIIGLWLTISGIISLCSDNDKNYIDV